MITFSHGAWAFEEMATVAFFILASGNVQSLLLRLSELHFLNREGQLAYAEAALST